MLFYYKRTFKTRTGEDKTVEDCFNVDTVIRGVQMNDDEFVVLLNDGHETSVEVHPEIVRDGKKVKDAVKQRQWIMSEIYLNNEDAARFRKLLEIGNWSNSLPDQQQDSVYDAVVSGNGNGALLADTLVHSHD